LLTIISFSAVIGLIAWFVLKKIFGFEQSRVTFWLATIFIILAVLFILAIVIGLHIQNRAPPEPAITYGEFPFRLEYEMDGERFVIEDTVIIEFIGSFRGKINQLASRRWSSELLNGGDSGQLEHGSFLLKETNGIRISFRSGSAAYFMDDPRALERSVDYESTLTRVQPHIILRNPSNTSLFTRIVVEEAHELLAEHGITLISWEYTPPITNSFG